MSIAGAAEAIDCLAYLAADAEWKKATDLYREAEVSRPVQRVMFEAIEAARRVATETQEQATAELKRASGAAKSDYDYWLRKARREYRRIASTYHAGLGKAIGKAHARAKALFEAHGKAKQDGANPKTVSAAYAAWWQAENDTHALKKARNQGPIPAALSEHRKRKNAAKANYTKALDSAKQTFRKAYDGASAPWAEADAAAREAYEQARTQAMAAAKPALDAARERFAKAYMAAYANPAVGISRDISGYDKEIVLQAAQGERKRCTQ